MQAELEERDRASALESRGDWWPSAEPVAQPSSTSSQARRRRQACDSTGKRSDDDRPVLLANADQLEGSFLLEECGLPYRVVPVHIGRGEQFSPSFVGINPNARVPAIVDREPTRGGAPLAVFERGAILQYFAEKSGLFLPADKAGRSRTMSWLMWQMSRLGPTLGQNGHFLLYAKEKLPYAIERYRLEARRLYGMLDSQLGMTGAHIAGRGLLHRRHRLFPLG